jgi:ribosomal-protein-alanine N-acetyltransferase
MTITSERLHLRLLTPAFLRASLAGDIAQAERMLGAPLPADWPDCQDLLSLRLKQIEDDSAYEPWSLRAIVQRHAPVMVGHIGFHTAPGAEYLRSLSPGAVEFGFTIFPAFRRQGFAREASLAMIQWAREVHGVQEFILSIRPDNMASQALAAGLGFQRIGSHIDEVDGLEDILELAFGQST